MPGQIDAAHERHLLVDHDQLLVVAGAGRSGIVVPHADPPVPEPNGTEQWQGLALQQVDEGVVPEQDPDSEPAVLPYRALKYCGERRRLAPVAPQPHFGVQIPSNDYDRVGGALDGVRDSSEICLSVHQKRHPPGAHPPPAVAAFD